MGFFDNPFGGLFDFNKDGKEDLGEQWIAYKIFEESTKSTESDNEDYGWRRFCEDGFEFGIDPEDYETEEEYNEALEEAKYGWRNTVEDGLEFGIDPEDYETEEEYNDALYEAKDGWRDTVEDGLDFGVDPEDYKTEEEYNEALEEAINASVSAEETNADDEKEIKESDYPNKRQYKAAATLYEHGVIYIGEGYEKRVKDRCRFILEQSDRIVAANYLTVDGDFLFSQAVKDNFELPVTLPDEDEESEFPLRDILKKIQRKNVPLALKIWEWCIEKFLPYADYSSSDRRSMTTDVLNGMYIFTDDFKKAFRKYLSEHAGFRTKLIREADDVPRNLSDLIVNMIKDGYTDAAVAMFDDGLFKADGKWKKVNNLMNGLISSSKNYDELETIEFVEYNFLPKMSEYSDGMILDEVEFWQQDIEEYKKTVERDSEKYAFSRSNAWRNTVPDGSEYGLDPRDYDTEQEYNDALLNEKYAWRDWAAQNDTLGLNPEDYETEKEYNEARQMRYDKQQKQEREEEKQRQLLQQQRDAERIEQQKKHEAELLNDKTIYTYCGVKLPFSINTYSFRTNDSSLKIGDTVIVPLGEENKETQGIIVSIGQYSRIGAPYPPEKTKFILRKKPEND